LLFSLPEGLAIRQILGPDVGGWGVEGTGAERTLRVFLRRKVEDLTRVTFDLALTQTLEDTVTTYTIPEFAPRQLTRETGTLAIIAEPQFTVRITKSTGLSQRDAKSFRLPKEPGILHTDSAPEFVYSYAARPFQLDLVVNRRQPQLKATAEHRVGI